MNAFGNQEVASSVRSPDPGGGGPWRGPGPVARGRPHQGPWERGHRIGTQGVFLRLRPVLGLARGPALAAQPLHAQCPPKVKPERVAP